MLVDRYLDQIKAIVLGLYRFDEFSRKLVRRLGFEGVGLREDLRYAMIQNPLDREASNEDEGR